MTAHEDPAQVSPGAADELASDRVENARNARLLGAPTDYSAVGGPDTEAAYGRTRSMAGKYPFKANGGSHDRDEPSRLQRGGYQTHRRITPLAGNSPEN